MHKRIKLLISILLVSCFVLALFLLQKNNIEKDIAAPSRANSHSSVTSVFANGASDEGEAVNSLKHGEDVKNDVKKKNRHLPATNVSADDILSRLNDFFFDEFSILKKTITIKFKSYGPRFFVKTSENVKPSKYGETMRVNGNERIVIYVKNNFSIDIAPIDTKNKIFDPKHWPSKLIDAYNIKINSLDGRLFITEEYGVIACNGLSNLEIADMKTYVTNNFKNVKANLNNISFLISRVAKSPALTKTRER